MENDQLQLDVGVYAKALQVPRRHRELGAGTELDCRNYSTILL